MADFVKAIDPNHLVMVGTWGYFGVSSPQLMAENPYDLSWRSSDSSNNAGIWSAGEPSEKFPLDLLTWQCEYSCCKTLVGYLWLHAQCLLPHSALSPAYRFCRITFARMNVSQAMQESNSFLSAPKS